MTERSIDLSYLRARAQAERLIAESSTCLSARKVHLAMARRYDEQIAERDYVRGAESVVR